MDGAAGHQAHVEIGGADGDQAAPGQKHVPFIEKTDSPPGCVAGLAESGAREAIELPSGEMPQRVAGKRVERQQNNVRGQDKCAQADAEVAVEVESLNNVMPEKQNEHDCEVEKITVNILQDEGKLRFALVFAVGRFTDCASRRIEKKRTVISFAVVIAGSPKTERPGKDEQRRRKFPPMMQRIDERRIERREVRPPFVKLAFESAQRGIKTKPAKKENHGQDFDPPSVAAQRASKPRFGQEGWRASHLGTSRVAVSKLASKLWQTNYIQDAAEGLISRADRAAKMIGCPNRQCSSVYLVAEQEAFETDNGGLGDWQ